MNNIFNLIKNLTNYKKVYMKKMNYYDILVHYIRVFFTSLRVLINDVFDGLTLQAFLGMFILDILLFLILSYNLDVYTLVIFILILIIDYFVLFSNCLNSLMVSMDDRKDKDFIGIKFYYFRYFTYTFKCIINNKFKYNL